VKERSERVRCATSNVKKYIINNERNITYSNFNSLESWCDGSGNGGEKH
jgi:hypothetical protein